MAGVLETVQCTGCGRSYGFQEKHRGKVLKCRACGGKVVIPEKAAELDVLEVVPQLEALPELLPERLPGPMLEAVPEAGDAGEYGLSAGAAAAAPKPAAGFAAKPAAAKGKPNVATRELAVDTNAGLRALKKFYADWWDALGFYAKRRAATYSARNAPSNCELCGAQANKVRKFSWRCRRTRAKMDGWTIGLSVLLLAVGRVGIFFRRQRATFRFDTYHTICPKCWFGHRTEVRTLAIVGLTCGTAAAVGVGLWLTTLLIHTHTEPDYVCLLVGVPAGLVAGLVGLYVVGKVLGAFMGTPRKLRYMHGGANGFSLVRSRAL